jgi:pimeloyl-ACP methyl ester carboxylesterase
MPTKKRCAVVFVHGLAKKPPLEKLDEIWRWGLKRDDPKHDVFPNPNPGIDFDVEGVPCAFSYYADVFYGTDYETEFGSYYESNLEAANETEVPTENIEKVAGAITPPQPDNAREQRFLEEFERKLAMQPSPPTPPSAKPRPQAKDPGELEIASWLPGPAKEAIIKRAAMEAYYFLFNKEYLRPSDGKTFKVRAELRRLLLDALRAANDKAEKTVLVTHSMGTMIAYDVLRNCDGCPPVDTLFTLGSPLGIREVQDELVATNTKSVDFPAATLRRWINVYDPLDVVCGADPVLANDFTAVDGRSVEDVKESNWGSWRHTITHYFAGKSFRSRLAEALGIER